MAGKTLESTVRIAGELSPSLKKSIENAVNRLEEMRAETLQNAGAAAELAAEISTQESVLKSLQKGYENYVVSGEESSEEAERLADTIQVLSREMDENKAALDAAEAAAKNLTRAQENVSESTEEAGESAQNSSEGFTVLKGAIADLAADAIENAIEKFKELTTSGDNALAMLEARTGSTATELEGFEDVMYQVYNGNYGESLEDVSEKLSTVIQMTDNLDKASLAQVTQNAIALEDVFGFDVAESMRAVNSLMDQFGLTSEQAFNLVVQGAQKGLNQNDDLLDTINEYSVQFKNAGYTADEMFNMLANGAASGTWSVDKLGDAVKEFNIRASDGTVTEAILKNAKALGMTEESAKSLGKEIESGSVEAYQKLLDKLKQVDDDAQRYALGVAMYGTMWEDLGEETVYALMNTQGGLKSTTAAMQALDDAAYDTLEGSLGMLGRTVEAEVVQPIAEKLTPIIKNVVDFITTKVGPAVDWVLDNLPTIGILLGGIAAAFVAFKWGSIVSGISAATTAFSAFNTVLAANPIGLIILAVTALVAGFVYLWNNCEEFRQFWIDLWDGIKEAAQKAADWLGKTWEKIKTKTSTIWKNIGKTISDKISEAHKYVQSTAEKIKTATSNAWDNISNNTATTWEKLKTTISEKINAAKNTVSSVVQTVKSVVSNAWNTIKSTTSTIWSNIQSSISEKINSAKSTVSSALESIKSYFSSKLSSAYSTVTSTFSNIFSTIQGKMESAKQKVDEIIEKIKSAFSFSLKLDIKLPHVSVTGGVAPYGIGGKGSLPKFNVSWYADGAIFQNPTLFNTPYGLKGVSEAGAEAVLPLDVLWDKLEAILTKFWDRANVPQFADSGLIRQAGELLKLDDFSLGTMSNETSSVIYYDFSGFNWSPHIQTNSGGTYGCTSAEKQDILAALKENASEFFDWLEEWVRQKEVGDFDRVGVY